MIPYKIGNWLINKEGIIWDGPTNIDYKILKNRILESREDMYDWLTHMPEKSWLTREDIYALNTAFIYAIEVFNISLPKELSFVETFVYQEKELNNK